jgi:phage-related minor tail protein
MEEMEDKEEDELDLESVLAELEKDLDDEDQMDEMEDKDEEEMDESEDKEEDEKMDENDVSSDIGKSDNKVNAAANDSTKIGQGPEGEGSDKKAGSELGDHTVVKENEDAEENDLDLDEVLRALTEEDAEEQDAEENEKLKSEIKEHRKVIHFMRSKLNEVNLLNAKLLFSNKLFRAFGLNNNQKLKVVETFDRTKNLREVKLVYATLAESFKRPGKLSESVSKGSSSKPTRSTKPAKAQVLSEGAELKARFKKLANIL